MDWLSGGRSDFACARAERRPLLLEIAGRKWYHTDMFKYVSIAILSCVASAVFGAAAPSEISVKLLFDCREWVQGERIRAVVDVANSSGDTVVVAPGDAADKLVLELARASDGRAYPKCSGEKPFTAKFALGPSEGQKLETFLGDHFAFSDATRYLARAVLVHGGMRYESPRVSFDVVPGVKCGGAMQVFSNVPGLKRMFELVYWRRGRGEHLFVKSHDEDGGRRWRTYDVGTLLRVTEPKVSVQTNGVVTVLHRATQDEFIRTEFWSLKDAVVFRENERMTDPDVAGAERVKALYMEAGETEPVKKAWWKFW